MAALIPAANALGFVGKHWSWFAMAGLVIALGIDHARLNHAKADQLDRRSCVAHQPCKPLKWQAEAKADERTIEEQGRQLAAGAVSIQRLSTALDQQSAAVAAQHDAGAKALAEAEAAVRAQSRAVAAANARAAALARPLAGADQCARTADFDLTFVESLK